MKTAKQSIDLEYKGTKKRLNLRTALISLCMFAFVGMTYAGIGRHIINT